MTRALAVISGLGGAAVLVSFSGGVITWLRFDQAHIPADQAVAATPDTELVAIGAVALVTFGLIGLLAVLVVYLLDSTGRAGKRNRYGVVVLAALGVIVAIGYSRPSDQELVFAGLLTVAIAVTAAYAGGHLLKHRADKGRLPIGLSAAITLLVVVLAAALWGISGEKWVGGMTVVAGLLAVGLLAVAIWTGSDFRWFGVGVFLAVLVFGAVMSTLRTLAATKLQPIAVLIDDPAGSRGVSGLYVAETTDRVYLAEVDHCTRHDLVLTPTDHGTAGTGRIMAIPRASVNSLAIGERQPLRRAETQGPELLAELRRRAANGSLPQRDAVATPHPCADEGVVDLTRRAPTKPPAPEQAAQLAERFRPILRFDSQERWRPLNVTALMSERDTNGGPRHRVCALIDTDRQDEHACEPLAGDQDLADEQSAARVIDFAGTRLDGGDYRGVAKCPPPQDSRLLDCDRGPAAAMYYRVSVSGRRTYVDYWWFLRFNDFAKAQLVRDFCTSKVTRRTIGCFNHEGDWEGVTVVSAKDQPRKLAFVDMASHEGVFRYAAAELDVRGFRPVVYVANGSHASYPDDCDRHCNQRNGRLPETNSDGEKGWGANSDCPIGTCLIALPAKSFNAFAGRWGSPVCTPRKNCAFAAGPKTPSRQRRYQRPWCFTAPGPQLKCDGTPLRE